MLRGLVDTDVVVFLALLVDLFPYNMSIRLPEVLRVLSLFDSTGRKHKCCLVFSGTASLPNGKVYDF